MSRNQLKLKRNPARSQCGYVIRANTAVVQPETNTDLATQTTPLKPSENWHRGNLSKYEFIGVKRCRPEDLQCESEKAMRVQRTSENSEHVPTYRSYRPIDHLQTCLPASLVPVQSVTVLLLRCVLYKGTPPMSEPSLLPSLPSPLGHRTWLALQQHNLPGAPIPMSMVWVVSLVVLSTIPSILGLQRGSDRPQYVHLHHTQFHTMPVPYSHHLCMYSIPA